MKLIIRYSSAVLLTQYLVLAALGPSAQPLHEAWSTGCWPHDANLVVHRHGAGSHFHVHLRPKAYNSATPTRGPDGSQSHWSPDEDWHTPHDCALLTLVSRLELTVPCKSVRVPLLSETCDRVREFFLWRDATVASSNLCRGPPFTLN